MRWHDQRPWAIVAPWPFYLNDALFSDALVSARMCSPAVFSRGKSSMGGFDVVDSPYVAIQFLYFCGAGAVDDGVLSSVGAADQYCPAPSLEAMALK